MESKGVRILALVAVFVPILAVAAPASEIPAVMDAIAARLEQNQVKQGFTSGEWDDKWGFNGSIVTGMVDAYERTEKELYRASAALGGEFILRDVPCDAFLGDEVYAFFRLGVLDGAAGGGQWQTVVERFFDAAGSTPQAVFRYTDLYYGVDSSTAVFYLAYFAVAAHDANVAGAAYWRQALIDHLGYVGDDSAEFPVMALGVATWALTQTGVLDDTLVGRPDADPYWEGVRLCDLPGLLAGHQVPEGEPLSGSFYWRFDHTSGPFPGPIAGYTEDTIYGTLGLVAFASLKENADREDLKQAILAARDALLAGVDTDGTVYEHLSHEGKKYYAYAGEMLQALSRVEDYLKAQQESVLEEAVPVGQ